MIVFLFKFSGLICEVVVMGVCGAVWIDFGLKVIRYKHQNFLQFSLDWMILTLQTDLIQTEDRFGLEQLSGF